MLCVWRDSQNKLVHGAKHSYQTPNGPIEIMTDMDGRLSCFVCVGVTPRYKEDINDGVYVTQDGKEVNPSFYTDICSDVMRISYTDIDAYMQNKGFEKLY